MLGQHFWGGSVAVMDGNLLRGLTFKCTRVKGLWVKGGGSWFYNIFFLAQHAKFTLIPISKAEGLVPACLSPFYLHYWSVSIFFLFSVCLHLFLIFCLSLTFSSFLTCLHLYPHFLAVSISIFIFCQIPSLYGDRQKRRIKMEADRQMKIEMETDT